MLGKSARQALVMGTYQKELWQELAFADKGKQPAAAPAQQPALDIRALIYKVRRMPAGWYSLVPLAIPQIQAGDWQQILPLQVIYFYDSGQAYYDFTNFGNLPITLAGVSWKTSEFPYQAAKFTWGSPAWQAVANAPRSMDALNAARAHRASERVDWRQINIPLMLEICREKIRQHPAKAQELLASGNAVWVEAAIQYNDKLFGAGNDGFGRNLLGQIFMHIRDELKQQRYLDFVPYDPFAQAPNLVEPPAIKAPSRAYGAPMEYPPRP